MKTKTSIRTAIGVAVSILFLPFFGKAAEPGSLLYGKLLTAVMSGDSVHWDRFGPENRKLLGEVQTWIKDQDLSKVTDRDEQLAFWINAHNVCVMKLVLEHFPLEDVMKIPGFRDKLTCEISGSPRSLNDLESGIIRPLFQEPRIHFALWWGAQGGPPLRKTPYEGKTLEKDLTDQTEICILKRDFVKLDKESKKFVLSPILDWYKTDFGTKPEAVLDFLKPRLSKEDAAKLPKRWADVKFGSFNWALDQAK